MTRIGAFLASPWHFRILLVLDLLLLFLTRSDPSVDGPAHLYNALILKALWSGDALMGAHFMVHPWPVPNWLDHAIMAPLLFVLSPWAAQKVLLMAYLTGMALGFRAVLRTWAPEQLSLAPLVFPFMHFFLFHIGFYNFSLGLALALLTIAFWSRHVDRWRWGHTVALTALALLLYFSNALALALTVAVLGCLLAQRVWRTWRSADPWLPALRPALHTGAAFVPAVALFLWFLQITPFHEPDPPRPFAELVQWIVDCFPLVLFHTPEEPLVTRWYSIILALLLLVRLLPVQRLRWRQGDLLLVPILCLTALYFTTPDSAHAGLMSERYLSILFVLLALWTAATVRPTWQARGLVLTAALLQLGQALWITLPHRRELDRTAVEMREAGEHLRSHAVVYPVNFVDHWAFQHVSNHLAVAKPLVILENYEARLGWFPVRWAPDRPEQRCLDDRPPYGVRCAPGPLPLPEHVVLHGRPASQGLQQRPTLQAALDEGYRLVHRSPSGHVEAYTRKDLVP